jgi:methyltransferase (TIGR00027 family)
MVAMFRAAADAGFTDVKGFSDPTAKHMLEGAWLRRLERAKSRRWLGQTLRYGGNLLALRTMVIDDAVRAGLARGAKQLVILGAGLDGRAFRMAELVGVHVFEVDHPATQALKRERASVLTKTCAELTYVPVDFERDALQAALQAAGHRTDVPTVWVWEGVVMYLTLEALRATLAIISARSAPQSTTIVQYNTRERKFRLMSSLVLRFWGEPQIGLRTPDEMASELHTVQLKVLEDMRASEWAAGRNVPLRAEQGARVVTAVR